MTTTTASNRVKALEERKNRLEAEFAETRERKDKLRQAAARMVAEGQSPNGQRAEIRDLDTDLVLLADALDQVEADLSAARSDATVEFQAEARQAMAEFEAKAEPAAHEIIRHARGLVDAVDSLAPLASGWAVKRAQSTNGRAPGNDTARAALLRAAVGPDGADAIERYMVAVLDGLRVALRQLPNPDEQE